MAHFGYALRDRQLREELVRAKTAAGAPEIWMVTWSEASNGKLQSKWFLDESDANSQFELYKSQGYPVMLADGLNEHDWTNGRSGISGGHGSLHSFVQFSGHALREVYTTAFRQQ
eukprot:TRINITY_DN9277_c0_g1_i1.p1 TRINITY_DN9277_c0_g1~~TRINITY_DN9277_c0_g1_i1.p1  ORF type:complete len:115 (+),score=18.91 TRINITY_DN9277_c0_g1_i1:108-452(+)